MKLVMRNAIEKGNLPRLRELLDEAGDGIDLDARFLEVDDDDLYALDQRSYHAVGGGGSHDTALGFAAEHDNPEMVEFLLARGAKPDVMCEDFPGYFLAPLHIVSGHKKQFNAEIAQLLIHFGASVDVLDSYASTPLHFALANDNIDMVELLLRHGADPLLQDPLMKEYDVLSRPVIFQAIEKFAQGRQGRNAVDRDRTAFDNGASFRLIWRWIIERKNITMPVDEDGNTVLHIAVKNGAAGALYTMLRACVCQTGLSASVLNSNLESPLAVAISALNLEAARFILLFGGQPIIHSNFVADPDPSQSTLASPLLRAFKILLHHGESPRHHRQKQFDQLRQMIVDSGYPLGREKWLNNDFDEVLHGLKRSVEFRDIVWEDVPQDLIDVAKLSFESLKLQRRHPLPLKNLARLVIRRSVMENPCLRCRLDALEKPSLEGLMELLNLPPQLRNFVTYLDF